KMPAKPSAINLAIIEDSPLERVCMKMVAKLPEDRFASMLEVESALEALLGKDVEIPVQHTSRLSRLRSWSTGIFASVARGGGARKSGGRTSSESGPDPNTPTVFGPQ